MKRLWRWINCWIFDEHDNKRARELGWEPLFPIRCDHCGTLYYHWISHVPYDA